MGSLKGDLYSKKKGKNRDGGACKDEQRRSQDTEVREKVGKNVSTNYVAQSKHDLQELSG